jgi:polyhydroxyalkanoate synthase
MFPTTCDEVLDESWKIPRRIRTAMELAEGEIDPPVAATEKVEVGSCGRVKLYYYPHTTEDDGKSHPPVLMVPSIINRYYVLDLHPGNSLVEHLRDAGIPVYLIDWGTPGPQDRHSTLETHVLKWLHAAVRRTCRHSGFAQTHLLGYCIGGTIAAMYAAARPKLVGGLIAMTAPIDFSDDGTLSRWARAEEFPVEKLAEGMGLVDSEWLQGSFKLLKPMSDVQKWRNVTTNLWDHSFLERFLPMEQWVTDNVDVPGPTYVEIINDLYRDNKLAKGALEMGGKRLNLHDIKCPVMIAEAQSDHIVPSDSSDPLATLVGSNDVEVHGFRGGHIGLVVGRASKEGLRPDMTDWLEARPLPRRQPLTDKEIQ